MDDCAALLALAAETAGAQALRRSAAAPPIPSPSRSGSPSPRRSSASPASTCWHLRWRRPRRPGRRRGRAGIRVADDDTWADIFSRVLVEKIEPQPGPRAGRRSSANTRSPRPRWPGPAPAIRASPSASSSMPAGSSWPTPSASSPTRPSSAAASRPRWPRRRASTASAIRIDEDFLAALAHMPPACGAALGFDRLVMLATGASRIDQVLWTPVARLDARARCAPVGAMIRRTLRTPQSSADAGLIDADRLADAGAGGRALRRGDHPGDGRTDRPADPDDPIGPPVPARRRRARPPRRGARRPDRRRRPQPGRRDRPPLSRPRAAQAHPRLRRLLPLLLPPRDGRAGRGRGADRRRRSTPRSPTSPPGRRSGR